VVYVEVEDRNTADIVLRLCVVRVRVRVRGS